MYIGKLSYPASGHPTGVRERDKEKEKEKGRQSKILSDTIN